MQIFCKKEKRIGNHCATKEILSYTSLRFDKTEPGSPDFLIDLSSGPSTQSIFSETKKVSWVHGPWPMICKANQRADFCVGDPGGILEIRPQGAS